MAALQADDAVVATHREHGHAIARGVDLDAIMAEMLGKAAGCSRGRGGSMHLFDAATNFYGGNAIVGAGLPIASGIALADRLTGQPAVTAVLFGEGAVTEGEFHETMNLASLWRLPVLFCCENNRYAMGTDVSRAVAGNDLVTRAVSYAMQAETVDGMDVSKVAQATRRTVAAIRRDGAPRFLEFVTYRYRAHSMYDPELYRRRAEVEQWRRRDPIELLRSDLERSGRMDARRFDELVADADRRIERAARRAAAAETEPESHLYRFVYSPREQPR